MSEALSQLVEHLSLEQIEENIFRGQSKDLGWGRVFGGQVLGQALVASSKTVSSERHVHSLHAYFLRAGQVDKPIVYEVDRIRDGRSFTTRRVVAVQAGRAIFNMSASFHIKEDGAEHAAPMPAHPGPDGIANEEQQWKTWAPKVPESLRGSVLRQRPIELRRTDPIDYFAPEKKDGQTAVWIRANGALPDDPRLHRALLAYSCDFAFFPVALRPHGISLISPRLHAASIDHAMWFHDDFRLDDWVLHVIDSPWSGSARGLVRGQFFTPDGKLVASTAQEGLMRLAAKGRQKGTASPTTGKEQEQP